MCWCLSFVACWLCVAGCVLRVVRSVLLVVCGLQCAFMLAVVCCCVMCAE